MASLHSVRRRMYMCIYAFICVCVGSYELSVSASYQIALNKLCNKNPR